MKGFIEEYGVLILEIIAGLTGLMTLAFLLINFSDLAEFVARKLMG